MRQAGGRAVLAGLLLESPEPSTDNGVNATRSAAIERRMTAPDRGTMETDRRADLLVVHDNPPMHVTKRRREALAPVMTAAPTLAPCGRYAGTAP